MAEQLDQWSIEKVIVCLKRTVYRDVLPSISLEERNRIKYTDVFQGEKELYLFLMLLYERSRGKLEIYGTIDEMIESLRKVGRIPDFIKFSSTSGIKVSSNCALLTQCVEYTERIEETIYSSQSDIAISVYVHVTDAVKSFKMNELTYAIFQTWQTTRLNKILQGYEESYNIIPYDSRKPFIDACEKFRMREPIIEVPKESIKFASFFKLKEYFDSNYEKVLGDVLASFEDEMRDVKKQDYIKETYAQVVFLIANIKSIYDEHAGIFELPSKIKKTPSMDDKPVIRLIKHQILGGYYLSKEIKDSIQKLMITNEFREKCKDLILLESEEERKNGIVYAIRTSEFKELLEKLNCTYDNFAICTITEEYQNMPLSIISSYGTHCIPVVEAFGRIVHYLTVILKVFQKCKSENLQQVFKWIEKSMDSFFVQKSVLYLIELSKVDELIKKARKDLMPFLSDKPVYTLDSQKKYTKEDVFNEFVKLFGNLKWKDNKLFKEESKIIINNMPSENITIKNIYDGYSDVVVSFLMEKYRKKIGEFIENQVNHIRRDIDANSPDSKTTREPERETFTELKKRVENTASSKKQEPKQQENIPSCSTENAGNRAEELEEELEKLVMDKDRVEKLEEQEPKQQENIPSCSTENAGNGAQKLGEELKKLGVDEDKIKKLEEEKTRLKTANEDSEKEIKKLQEELEKSQKSNAELEGIMNNMISQLNTLTVNFQKQIQKPREDLETENVENMELENKSEMPGDDREDLKRKVELLMSENEELRAQKLRITEFEGDVETHTKSALSHLNPALGIYPDLNSLKKLEIDLLQLKYCLDKYRGDLAGYAKLED